MLNLYILASNTIVGTVDYGTFRALIENILQGLTCSISATDYRYTHDLGLTSFRQFTGPMKVESENWDCEELD